VKDPAIFDMENPGEISWCPGCGDFHILEALKKALAELDLEPHQVVAVSGIGQAAKLPHYMRCHFFNGLHGRALSHATAIKVSNPELVVLAIGGDGDMYGEGGNHFLHTIRRNPDIANFVHNNMVYGLTKGQASPTSPLGFRSPTSPEGTSNLPMNPLAVAISLGAAFVARAFSGDVDKTKEIMKRAILHRGYALVDILQPCVSFNKVNTFKWYRDNTYYVGPEHNPRDPQAALALALQADRWPLGVLFVNPHPTFEETRSAYGDDARPLFRRPRDPRGVREFLEAHYR